MSDVGGDKAKRGVLSVSKFMVTHVVIIGTLVLGAMALQFVHQLVTFYIVFAFRYAT
nr:hypothetical protein [uncultured Cupriavidus sp.]